MIVTPEMVQVGLDAMAKALVKAPDDQVAAFTAGLEVAVAHGVRPPTSGDEVIDDLHRNAVALQVACELWGGRGDLTPAQLGAMMGVVMARCEAALAKVSALPADMAGTITTHSDFDVASFNETLWRLTAEEYADGAQVGTDVHFNLDPPTIKGTIWQEDMRFDMDTVHHVISIVPGPDCKAEYAPRYAVRMVDHVRRSLPANFVARLDELCIGRLVGDHRRGG